MDSANERIEISIFRFDRSELEKAMIRAVGRGVFVHALIAYTNSGGEKSLRQLEMRLLAHGVTVARTADDLVRYHGKFMIIDRKELHVLGFNFTYLDMEHSRSFGLITRDAKLVKEAVNLFDADTKRQTYTPGSTEFIVSPVNARSELASFINGAQKELAIYDPKIADPSMIRLLEERAAAGVDIKILGKPTSSNKLAARNLSNIRLHVRAMIRDRSHIFLGSQSLRTAELETRREVGLILDDSKIAKRILKTFEEDWTLSGEHVKTQPQPAVKAARKVAKAVAKSLPTIDSMLELLAAEGAAPVEVDSLKLQEAMKVAVKQAVEQSVLSAVEEASGAPQS
jgi:cardiolipin synthase